MTSARIRISSLALYVTMARGGVMPTSSYIRELSGKINSGRRVLGDGWGAEGWDGLSVTGVRLCGGWMERRWGRRGWMEWRLRSSGEGSGVRALGAGWGVAGEGKTAVGQVNMQVGLQWWTSVNTRKGSFNAYGDLQHDLVFDFFSQSNCEWRWIDL